MHIDKKKNIAVFDFDGTITRKDTLFYFILFATTKIRFLTGTLLAIPHLFLFKTGIIKNHIAKERLFRIFFSGLKINQFNAMSEKFSSSIDKMTNPIAIDKIKWHQERGHEVIIISASAENWVLPWAIKNNIKTVLATKLQVDNDEINGKFLTKNCYGQEKVNRFLEKYPDNSEYVLHVYGDSEGDKEILGIADHKYYRTFAKKL